MGTTIEQTAVVRPGWRDRKSALRLTDAAARRCLAEAGAAPGEVDLLVNTGIYRDRNLGEPALAALVQEDLGIHSEEPHAGGHGGFSFDVSNGMCGPLTALQIIDRFTRAGTVRHGLVVTSDADPGHHLAPGFPFSPAGGAVYTGWSDAAAGLGSLHWVTAPDDGETFRSTVGYEHGRNVLRIRIADEFGEQAGIVAAKAVAEALDGEGLCTEDVDVVVAAPADRSFVAALSSHAGFASNQVVVAIHRDLHTVAFVAALDGARAAGRLSRGKVALFVCAGAGITAGSCIYRA